MPAITLNAFMNNSMLWSDIVEKEEEEERKEKENLNKLEHAIAEGFVEVKRKEKKKKTEDVLPGDDWCHESLKLKEKFCMSVLNKTECKYGSWCVHAHNLEELVLTNCAYGKNCNKVKNGKNVDDANICLFVHPNEQGKDNLNKYLRRLGVETNVSKVRPAQVKTKPVQVPVEVKPVQVTVPVEVKPVQVEVKPVPVETKPLPIEAETKMFLDLTTNIVYVYVHHSNAQEVLKKLLESGKTQIQLNVY